MTAGTPSSPSKITEERALPTTLNFRIYSPHARRSADGRVPKDPGGLPMTEDAFIGAEGMVARMRRKPGFFVVEAAESCATRRKGAAWAGSSGSRSSKSVGCGRVLVCLRIWNGLDITHQTAQKAC
jgi:hypothetical protein